MPDCYVVKPATLESSDDKLIFLCLLFALSPEMTQKLLLKEIVRGQLCMKYFRPSAK